jgi:hypothetical protein
MAAWGLQLALLLVAVADPQTGDSSSYTLPATSIPLADFALVVLTVVAVIGHFTRKSK